MSTRSQCKINVEWREDKRPKWVYLYQHYDGYDLPNRVRMALRLRERWADADYLARIIFDVMKSVDGISPTTGFGISCEQQDDIEYLVEINPMSRMVRVISMCFDGTNKKTLFKGSFEGFCESTRSEW